MQAAKVGRQYSLASGTKVQTLGAYGLAAVHASQGQGHVSREKAGTREANGLDYTRMRKTQTTTPSQSIVSRSY